MSLIDSTVRVRRGGSFLTVPANAVDRYMEKGYDVVDKAGNVLKTSTPNDVNALKLAYEQHVSEIKALKEQVRKLEKQLAEVNTEVKVPNKEPEITAPVKKTKKSK